MLHEKQQTVREAICDNFNTKEALNELFQLVKVMNDYLDSNPNDIKLPIVRQVTRFVFHILKCFGVYETSDYPELTGGEAEASGAGGKSFEEIIGPFVDELVKYRTEVISKAKGDPSELFALSDKLRDEILPSLGIKVEDRGVGNASRWTYYPDSSKL